MTADCLEDERVARVLENAIEWMRDPDNQDSMDKYDIAGFEAGDVGAQGWEFPQLTSAGLIEQVYSSSNATSYRVTEVNEAEKALEASRAPEPTTTEQDVGSAEPREPVDTSELFTDVVGRDEPKKWLRRTIEKDADVHHLLVGEPGSGKSMILDDIVELPGAHRVVFTGNQSSAAGVRDILLEERPEYLVVEEIEKGSRDDREALMTVAGKGYVTTTKSSDRREVDLDTTVIAAGNQMEKITPRSLVDRLMVWPMKPYSVSEYKRVCREILPRDYGISEDLAVYIAEQIHEVLDSSSVREAERIAQLAENEADVDELVELIQ